MKKHIETFALILFCFLLVPPANAQERIYSNADLFRGAKSSISNGNFRRAETFLFALIQRNSEQYQGDQRLRQELNRALTLVRRNQAPQSGGTFDDDFLSYPERALGDDSGISVKFLSGTYRNNAGYSYQINRIGKEIWWLSTTPNKKWQSIMHGKILGNVIEGGWTLMPGGPNLNGRIKLRIENSETFVVQEVSGVIQGVGDMWRGTSWRRQ